MASPYGEQAEETGLRSDLDALDRIRRELHGRVPEVHLPGIVVIGNQSSGKSSVLESISGVPLPRGQGTVTRCPIQLSVRQAAEFSATVQSGATLKAPGAVSKSIQQAVQALVPANGFSNQAVEVFIHQPSGPNLTLTDLPGLIATFDNPNKGLIDSLVEEFLDTTRGIDAPTNHDGEVFFQAEEHKESASSSATSMNEGRLNVIVCVLDATSDWEAAAAISWAKQYNPSGDRTLFVITKIDRAVPGFRNLLDTLQRQYIRTQSKLGYVLVRNRTQEEINSNITAEQALKNEQDFFQGNNLQPEQLAVSMELRSLSKDKKGTIQLIKKLVEIQQEQIRKQMPGVRRKIDALIKEDNLALGSMASYAEDEPTAQRELQSRLAAATRAFQALYHGDFGSEDRADMKVSVQVKTRVHALRQNIWGEVGGNDGERIFGKDEFAQKVRAALQDEAEMLPNMSHNFPIMKQLYYREVHVHIWPPCEQLINEVRIYLGDVWRTIVTDIFSAFPRLREAVLEQVERHLDERKLVAEAFVKTLISHAKSMFTVNPGYNAASSNTLSDIKSHRDGLRSQGQPIQHAESSSPSSPELGAARARTPAGSLRTPPSNPVVGVAALANPTDSPAQSWMLRYMHQEQPAAWNLADKLAIGINLSKEERRVTELQFLQAHYARVVVDRVCDDVPLAIYAILINQVLASDELTPGTALTEVLSMHFDEASSVLSLIHDPANLQKRKKLKDRLAALQAAKGLLPA